MGIDHKGKQSDDNAKMELSQGHYLNGVSCISRLYQSSPMSSVSCFGNDQLVISHRHFLPWQQNFLVFTVGFFYSSFLPSVGIRDPNNIYMRTIVQDMHVCML